ncbi:MAG: isopeptide-forming domain-containing fimbrial protein [Clostridium sp.]
MATISGRVVFDKDRSATITGVDTGLAGIPVVLQNINSNLRVTCSTDSSGNYSFINVPNGDYRIVEAYGQGSGSNPADFTSGAVSGPIPTGQNPPISFATAPPSGSTNLDSTSPDTLLISITGPDLLNQNFLDGPVIYTPITSILDQCATIVPPNLITKADSGTFGFFPAGTVVDTGASGTPPYPGVTPGFIYVMPHTGLSPADGQYTIQNIMDDNKEANENIWWRISDHTVGNETSRMMVVNGATPGAIFFTETVPVSPNTNYLFSSWVTNLLKVDATQPALRAQILDQNGNILYNQALSNAIPYNPNVPEWKQIGTVFNSGNNTTVTVIFISDGPAAAGNDYAIDDIQLQQINFPIFTPKKSVNTSVVNVGDIVTYTVTISNTCQSPLTSVFFKDILPTELQFVSGSVTGGTNPVTDNPNPGFTVPNIAGNSTATITFKAKAISSPPFNPTNNTATVNYSYTPVQGGIPNTFSQNTNLVPVTIYDLADLISPGNFVKTVDKTSANIGDILTYTIVTKNTGNVAANNVIITDVIPAGTTYVPGSVTSTVLFTGNPTTSINLTAPIPAGQSVTTTFKVKVGNAIPTTNPIPNTASIAYSYTADPNNPDGVKINGFSNTVNTTVSNATLVTKKTVDKTIAYVGDVLTYNISVTNTGNVPANNVIITDLLPNGTVYSDSLTVSVPYTGTPATSITLTNPIAAGQTVSISFKVTVTAIPNPNPINNTATVNYSFTVNPQQPDGVTATSTSNIATTVVFKYNFSQQITDLIESVALEEAALSAIMNSEGAKIQAMVAMNGITPQELLCVNKSVADMLASISILQAILKQKLNIVNCQIDPGNGSCS